MASNMLSPTQYRLPEADRQQILSTLPPEIDYPSGIIPAAALRQSAKLVSSIHPNTSLTVDEFHKIMVHKSVWERGIFQENNGYLL